MSTCEQCDTGQGHPDKGGGHCRVDYLQIHGQFFVQMGLKFLVWEGQYFCIGGQILDRFYIGGLGQILTIFCKGGQILDIFCIEGSNFGHF